MTFDLILDVAIGLALVFAFASVISSALNEILVAILNRRGRMLERAIYQLLAETNPRRANSFEMLFSRMSLGAKNERKGVRAVSRDGNENVEMCERFFCDPRIRALGDNDRLPSYVPAAMFAEVVMELLADPKLSGAKIKTFEGALGNAPLLVGARADTIGDIRTKIENYYEMYMDRVSGWYKRNTQFTLVVLGLVVAVFLNIDAIRIADALAGSAPLRAQTSESAISYLEAQEDGTPEEQTARDRLNEAYEELENLCLPIGWFVPEACKPKAKQRDDAKPEAPQTPAADVQATAITSAECKPGEAKALNRGKSTQDLIDEIPWSDLSAGANMSAPATPDCEDVGAPQSAVIAAPEEADAGADQGGQQREEAETTQTRPWWLSVIFKFIGIGLAGLAISLGAPFWFDLLSKFVSVRAAGKKPGEAAQKPSSETAPVHVKTPAMTTIVRPEENGDDQGGPQPTAPPPPPTTPSDYEKSLTAEDLRDICYLLGIAQPIAGARALDERVRREIQRAQRRYGMEPTGALTEAFVSKLFAAP